MDANQQSFNFLGAYMIYYFTVRDGMLSYSIKRYNSASANILRKQLDKARICYLESIKTL